MMEVRLAVRENVITPERLRALDIHAGSIADMLGTSHCAYCAEVDGEVVGFAMAERSAASIWALFIRPQWEGKGLGRRLMDVTLQALWQAGHQRATLSTEPETRAYRFYVRQGWRHTGFNAIGEAELELLRPD